MLSNLSKVGIQILWGAQQVLDQGASLAGCLALKL